MHIPFTIGQARTMVRIIKPRIKKLMQLERTLCLMESVELSFEQPTMNDDLRLFKMQKTFHELSAELYREMESLTRLGCIVRDVEQGVIDFYHLHEGRAIFLCWRYGERTLSHFHDPATGFDHRLPLTELTKRRKHHGTQTKRF